MIPAEFIMRLTNAAVESQRKSGVPASITIAQAALESAWGESGLAKSGNNLFGIKADSRWRGETLTLNTREFIKGQWLVVPAKWRKYASWQASIDDHAAFLKANPRYQPCFLWLGRSRWDCMCMCMRGKALERRDTTRLLLRQQAWPPLKPQALIPTPAPHSSSRSGSYGYGYGYGYPARPRHGCLLACSTDLNC